jgi:NAD(P)-dependent dehydrogenase (short-subunit alcohol dehydrogenase family)
MVDRCSGTGTLPAHAYGDNYYPEIVKRMISQAPIGRFGRPEEIASAVV